MRRWNGKTACGSVQQDSGSLQPDTTTPQVKLTYADWLPALKKGFFFVAIPVLQLHAWSANELYLSSEMETLWRCFILNWNVKNPPACFNYLIRCCCFFWCERENSLISEIQIICRIYPQLSMFKWKQILKITIYKELFISGSRHRLNHFTRSRAAITAECTWCHQWVYF